MNGSMPPDIRELLDDVPPTKREEMASVWAIFQNEGEARAQSFDADRTWRKLKREINLGEGVDEETSSERKRADRADRKEVRPARRRKETTGRGHIGSWFVGRKAAVLVLALTTFALGAWLWSRPVIVTTTKGTRTTTTLPDGSTVELNGGSTLSYQRGFGSLPFFPGEARRVRLEGEAFFSVHPGDRTFVVSTPNAQVRVLGTKFTVETFSGTGPVTTQVTLRSGRLQFAAADHPDRAVTLDKRGSRSQLSGASRRPTVPQQTPLGYAEAWRRDGFAVQEVRLSVALHKLERRFDTSIRLDADTVETRPMTLLYARDADLEEILTDICLIQDLSYRATHQGYVLTKPQK